VANWSEPTSPLDDSQSVEDWFEPEFVLDDSQSAEDRFEPESPSGDSLVESSGAIESIDLDTRALKLIAHLGQHFSVKPIPQPLRFARNRLMPQSYLQIETVAYVGVEELCTK